jgi:predicted AlkP superfamily phosphohydrolase/phosphomutase
MKAKKQPVLVLGLDGATFDIIEPLIQSNRLPHLTKLIRSGTSGRLRSTIMPNSFPAWASCTTGVDPGKHGIFWSLIRDEGTALPLRLMSSTDIRAKTVWELLGDQGREVCIVNVPTEYPPRPVNGSLICGALTPDAATEYTYPDELKDEILQIVPDYRCEIDYAHLSLTSLSKQLVRSIRNREKLIRHLLTSKQWDLFFAVFTETDLAQHKFWAGIDPHHPAHRKLGMELRGFVYNVYELLDEAVGRILGDIPNDTIVFVVSDHGFGPFYQSFSVSQWLANQGFLARSSPWHRRSVKWLMRKARMTEYAARIREQLNSLRHTMMGRRDVRALREQDVTASARLTADIDWSRTKAYSTPDYGIRLNLLGREPHGIVAQGDEENAVMRSIIEGLSRVRYSNGNPVFEAVLAREEAYHGPSAHNAPDIIIPIDHAHAPLLWGSSLLTARASREPEKSRMQKSLMLRQPSCTFSVNL